MLLVGFILMETKNTSGLSEMIFSTNACMACIEVSCVIVKNKGTLPFPSIVSFSVANVGNYYLFSKTGYAFHENDAFLVSCLVAMCFGWQQFYQYPGFSCW